ncbi:MAG: tetraacyldisaccharide 4'-kinase [Planctomycetota bacterium]|jgi:tetraacyldisaccharide 4'-kinase
MLSPQFLNQLWYAKHPLFYLLLPLSWLYLGFVTIRRFAYTTGVLPVQKVSVPVIVVGNITVGGTGKTPLIIWLGEYLKRQGMKPGFISRGYGGRASKWPQQVRADSNPTLVGDEPVLIAQRTQCPVAVSRNRFVAAKELLEHTDCDILLCDDGLQHLSLHRDIEIAVIDGDRRFGNGHCLPAGPLRESVRQLNKVDMIVSNAKAGKNEFLMEYVPAGFIGLNDEDKYLEPESLRGKDIHAVAGIGNPQRFFSYLRSLGMRVIKHEFPDHFHYEAKDLQFADELPIVMTEKDAVKCRKFALENCWYLKIDVSISKVFEHRLNILLKDINDG